MIKYTSFLVCFLIFSCTAKHSINVKQNKFTEFINNNRMVMRLDGVIINDWNFKLLIPTGLKKTYNGIGYAFVNSLVFDNDQAIVMIYVPNKKTTPITRLENLSYNDFINICEKEDIIDLLKDIHVKMNKHKHFGINKPKNGQFYAIYLNVRRSDIETFNYSINSIQ